MAVKGLIAAIIQFLTQQLEDETITEDSRESLEVAIQCLESAYSVQASDTQSNVNLLEVYKSAVETAKPELPPEATPEAKAEAEKLKNEGNNFMKAQKFQEALANYTKAIQLNGRNAVYYCNRAAAYSKLGSHQKAINDCHTALSIDPSYSKAYGRLGLAYSSMEKDKEAKASYEKALEMEPDNESYKNNLQVAVEKLAQQRMNNMGLDGDSFNINHLTSIMTNPTLLRRIQTSLSNPEMINVMRNFLSGNTEQRTGSEMGSLADIYRGIMQIMQNSNPELVETMIQQLERNLNDPQPPQQN
ncbi:small glutamine-rich tetratricopeptide repeat-containing protein alpha [Nomia melanderi]|uniref:small glutamine-rich tetratricopeptide repeat-containing protein alpha n=1 Tax=Nomia melanderi TaxID=2448451 RepID=UPI00130417DB|nr:small glutamine-rich tetratricopeptide repeat-containing protein alpha-like [Nomia melanderi]XP_031839503.1 small glutamine-rich tetratricopeptide repeat-containing protein alpha-like [Nomia melanderi]XP_031839504.1 small glutamine-rich tetratricopeptide repeat-containing protein alpha-like [Nomia melanderi]